MDEYEIVLRITASTGNQVFIGTTIIQTLLRHSGGVVTSVLDIRLGVVGAQPDAVLGVCDCCGAPRNIHPSVAHCFTCHCKGCESPPSYHRRIPRCGQLRIVGTTV